MAGEPAPDMDRPLRILLVEDNPDDAEITRFAVERTVSAEVTVISDGTAALRALEGDLLHDGERPDVILLDMRLPGADGLEILRRVRRQPAYRDTPVIVLTTLGDDEATILDCYESGANSFLAKPATSQRFADALTVLANALPRADAS